MSVLCPLCVHFVSALCPLCVHTATASHRARFVSALCQLCVHFVATTACQKPHKTIVTNTILLEFMWPFCVHFVSTLCPAAAGRAIATAERSQKPQRFDFGVENRVPGRKHVRSPPQRPDGPQSRLLCSLCVHFVPTASQQCAAGAKMRFHVVTSRIPEKQRLGCGKRLVRLFSLTVAACPPTKLSRVGECAHSTK